ncbi:SMI1/KNR4 family protein [Deinococcus sp. A31D244]|uniref:SMI1/KNR4 family protein n=1 Tax=Deinococcus sp. A31D244 TaxID=3397675 RepID=UPI0039E1A73A
MRALKITDSEPPVTAADLDRFEQAHGLGIPAAYRAFLLKHNGGSPSPENFRVAMEPRLHTRRSQTRLFGTAVEFFLSLNAENVSIRVQWPYVTEGRLQVGLFPIAYCGGDLLCLSTREDTRDQVFYWFSDEEDGVRADGDRNLYVVAPTFEDFLEQLHD